MVTGVRMSKSSYSIIYAFIYHKKCVVLFFHKNKGDHKVFLFLTLIYERVGYFRIASSDRAFSIDQAFYFLIQCLSNFIDFPKQIKLKKLDN